MKIDKIDLKKINSSLSSFHEQLLGSLALVHFSQSFIKAFPSLIEAATSRPVAPIELPVLDIIPREESFWERRAVVDVGSGSTKFCIADVDLRTNEVVRIIFSNNYKVGYQESLEKSYDHRFERELCDRGLEVFSEIDSLCQHYQVERISAVATEAFRQSTNGEAFAREVCQKTNIPLRIISQKEEGAIAFFSAASGMQNKDELIVWDIGTGSFQLTVAESDDDIVVFMGSLGSIPFKNYIIDVIQDRDSSCGETLFPFSREDYLQADRYARALARRAFPLIKDRIGDTDGRVVGVGRLFNNSLLPITEDGKTITRKDLRDFIESNVGKSADELAADPFAAANLSNAILVLGFMKALHIHEIVPVDTATTAGMLSYAPYWA